MKRKIPKVCDVCQASGGGTAHGSIRSSSNRSMSYKLKLKK